MNDISRSRRKTISPAEAKARVKRQADIVAQRARSAELEADRLERLARKIELEAEAYAYKASVEASNVATHSQKAKLAPEAKTKYEAACAMAEEARHKRLDLVHPDQIRPVFKKLFADLQRGKELEAYTFLDGAYLVSGDGTSYFSSDQIHCPDCCKKQHSDGKVSYSHQMMTAAIVHPDHATVIPFCPEPNKNGDGSTKNDCERSAAERLYRHIRREHPHLPLML